MGIMGCFYASGATNLEWFNEIFDSKKYHSSAIGLSDGYAIRNLLFTFFKDIAILLFILAVLMSFVATIKLLSSQNSEEDFWNWMKTLVWSLAGLFVISIAYTIIQQFEMHVTSTQTFSGQTMYQFTINIIYPILNFFRYIAAVCFFLASIYAFYRIVTSMGDEERAVDGRKMFFGSVLGFIIMIIAEPIVRIAYGGGRCGGRTLFWVPIECTSRTFDAAGSFGILAKMIVFLNWFIALITIIMIMYAGFLILTWGGDEEKSDRAKRTISYAIIGVIILLFSYVIYRFMILQS
jgi:hypothetical protein